jgi:hypothetical protein
MGLFIFQRREYSKKRGGILDGGEKNQLKISICGGNPTIIHLLIPFFIPYPLHKLLFFKSLMSQEDLNIL